MPSNIECPAYRDGLCPDIITAKEQLKNMTAWQTNQNGHLQRIDENLGKLQQRIEDKASRLQWWLIGVLGSALLAVALLAVNIASKII